jgi:hypothetical protein
VEAVAVGQVEAAAAYRGVATVLGRAGVSSPGLLVHSFFFPVLIASWAAGPCLRLLI